MLYDMASRQAAPHRITTPHSTAQLYTTREKKGGKTLSSLLPPPAPIGLPRLTAGKKEVGVSLAVRLKLGRCNLQRVADSTPPSSPSSTAAPSAAPVAPRGPHGCGDLERFFPFPG